MDRVDKDLLAIVLAALFWVFLLLTPIGNAILGFLLGFYEQFAP